MHYLTKLIIQNQNLKLFVGYIFFAGIATIVDFSFLYALTEFLNIWYFYSAALASVTSTITNFSLNKYFNFQNKSRQIIPQFGVFALVGLIGLMLNQIILYSLVEFAGMWYMAAKVISVFIVVPVSFYSHKKLTFNLFK